MRTLLEWASSFDASARPWLLLGKGPSFERRAEVDLGAYFTLALNDVVRELEVTVAHAIDLDVVVRCAEAIERNARFLVLPWRPHVRFDPGPKTLADLVDDLPVLARLSRAGRLIAYDLSSAPPSGASPRIEARFFSAEAALELLAVVGAREVRSLGVDGGTAYARSFDDLSARTRLANGQPSFDLQFEQLARVLRRRPGLVFGPLGVEVPARIFIGADPAQRLPARVLEWSLRRRASISLAVETVDDAGLPVPADPARRSRTGFSFGRFKLPALCGHAGRALYLDADMLALSDVAALWSTPLEGASVAYAPQRPGREGVQHSVLLLDCARLPWDAAEIVRGLDRGERSYDDLLRRLVLVPPDERRPLLPPSWNVAEALDRETCLIHYTDMPTQPWVSPANPHGEAWYAALREALDEGFIGERLLDEEVARGHVSPDLPRWLGLGTPRRYALLRAGWTPPFTRLSKNGAGRVGGGLATTASAALDSARGAVRRSRAWRRLVLPPEAGPGYGEALAAAPEVRDYPFRREEAKPGDGPLRARLEAERALFIGGALDAPEGPPLVRLVVLVDEPWDDQVDAALERTLRLWELQSCPRRDAVLLVGAGDPEALRRRVRARGGALPIAVDAAPLAGLDPDAFLVLARPGDGCHPSLATTVRRVAAAPGADLVAWHAQGPAADGAWMVLTSPEGEPLSALCAPLPPRAFALRVAWARRFPGDLARAARMAGGQALVAWLGLEPGARWVTHPEVLTAYDRLEDGARAGARTTAIATSMATAATPTELATVLAGGAEALGLRCVAAEVGAPAHLGVAAPALPWAVEPTPRAARVSVVVPFRDGLERVRACLEAVLAQETRAPCELVLVAHRTPLAVRAALEELLADRAAARGVAVRWVPYDGPFNHSLQCDLGARAATGEVLLLLNDDARLRTPGLLQALADWALVPGVGTVGCRLVGRDGRLISAGVRVAGRRARPWSAPVEESREAGLAHVVRETAANCFACAALARAVYEAHGPLDETWFPAGYNDVELCLRLRRAGLRHVYLGTHACEHEPHGSRPSTDELPQLLELWRRYPELLPLGDRQLARRVEARRERAPLPERLAETLRVRLGAGLRRAARRIGGGGP
jgi:hypothetical protein